MSHTLPKCQKSTKLQVLLPWIWCRVHRQCLWTIMFGISFFCLQIFDCRMFNINGKRQKEKGTQPRWTNFKGVHASWCLHGVRAKTKDLSRLQENVMFAANNVLGIGKCKKCTRNWWWKKLQKKAATTEITLVLLLRLPKKFHTWTNRFDSCQLSVHEHQKDCLWEWKSMNALFNTHPCLSQNPLIIATLGKRIAPFRNQSGQSGTISKCAQLSQCQWETVLFDRWRSISHSRMWWKVAKKSHQRWKTCC